MSFFNFLFNGHYMVVNFRTFDLHTLCRVQRVCTSHVDSIGTWSSMACTWFNIWNGVVICACVLPVHIIHMKVLKALLQGGALYL